MTETVDKAEVARWGRAARERANIADAVTALRSGEVMTVSCDMAPLIADLLTTFLDPNLRASRVRGWAEAARIANRVLDGMEEFRETMRSTSSGPVRR